LADYLRKIAYNPDKICFVPISAKTGGNMVEKDSKNMGWYTGPTLIEAMDQLVKAKQPREEPLRLPIHDVFQLEGVGLIAVGRIATGVIRDYEEV
jgi:elongation factor 1-alpha